MLPLSKYRRNGDKKQKQLTKQQYSIVHELFMHRGARTLALRFKCSTEIKDLNFSQCSVYLQKEVVKLNGSEKRMYNLDVLQQSWHVDVMGPVNLCKKKYFIFVNTFTRIEVYTPLK